MIEIGSKWKPRVGPGPIITVVSRVGRARYFVLADVMSPVLTIYSAKSLNKDFEKLTA